MFVLAPVTSRISLAWLTLLRLELIRFNGIRFFYFVRALVGKYSVVSMENVCRLVVWSLKGRFVIGTRLMTNNNGRECSVTRWILIFCKHLTVAINCDSYDNF